MKYRACGESFRASGSRCPDLLRHNQAAIPEPKTEFQHTPTPWKQSKKGSTIHIESPAKGYTVALIESPTDLIYSQDEANAAFIVKCVNTHGLLLSALHSIINSCPATKDYDDIVAIAEKAIATAEGRL